MQFSDGSKRKILAYKNNYKISEKGRKKEMAFQKRYISVLFLLYNRLGSVTWKDLGDRNWRLRRNDMTEDIIVEGNNTK